MFPAVPTSLSLRVSARLQQTAPQHATRVSLQTASFYGRDVSLLRTARVAPVTAKTVEPIELAGRAWVAASRFLPRSQSETLESIKHQVHLAAEVARRTGTAAPVVVFDLDGTLFDNRFRTLHILQEWLRQNPTLAPSLRAPLSTLHPSDIAYDLPGTFQRVGLSRDLPAVRDALDSASRFWKARFFTNAYQRYDRPLAGAHAFVTALREAGATIVYLTGRDEPNMGDGTRAALRAHGFPLDERTQLILKDRFETPDAEFKARALPTIRQRGPVLATFDNEPANVVVFNTGFKGATNVFVDTDYSDNPVPVTDGLSWVADFRP